jgi:hypothetical protein
MTTTAGSHPPHRLHAALARCVGLALLALLVSGAGLMGTVGNASPADEQIVAVELAVEDVRRPSITRPAPRPRRILVRPARAVWRALRSLLAGRTAPRRGPPLLRGPPTSLTA